MDFVLAFVYLLGFLITGHALRREKDYYSYMWLNGFEIDEVIGQLLIQFGGTAGRHILTAALWPITVLWFFFLVTDKRHAPT